MWAVEVLREVGAPVAVTMCIGPEGDMHNVTPGECAVKLVRAGKVAHVQMGSAVSGKCRKFAQYCQRNKRIKRKSLVYKS